MKAQVQHAGTLYDPDFAGLINLRTIDRAVNASDDSLTAQTVGVCADLVSIDAPKPIVRRATAAALKESGIRRSASDAAKCAAVWRYAKQHVRYVREAELEAPFNLQMDRELDQMLIPPAELLGMPEPKGDCPHFSMLVAAMLRNLGIPSSFKTIAADHTQPGAYSHIYTVAHTKQGDVLLDASNAPRSGVEYTGKVYKAKLWPIDAKRAPAASLAGLGDADGYDWGDLASSLTSIAGPILTARFAVPDIPTNATFQQRNRDGSVTQFTNGNGGAFASLGVGNNSNLLVYGGAALGLVLLLVVLKK